MSHDYAGMFAGLPDAVLAGDGSGRIVAASRQAEALLKFDRGQLVGRALSEIMTPELRAVHEAGLRRLLTAGQRRADEDAVLHGRALRADGGELSVELALSVAGDPDADDFLTLTSLREASEQVGSPRQAGLTSYLHAALAVARATSSADGPVETYRSVLPALCPKLDCLIGRLWLREPEGREMVCVDVWAREPELVKVASSPFGFTCRPGQGLAGECWARRDGLAVRIKAAEELFPNSPDLEAHGIHSAAAVPLAGADNVLGVLTMYSDSSVAADAATLDLMLVLGEAIGAVLEARQRDSAYRDQLRRHQLLLDASSAVASAAGYESALRMLASSAVPGLADLCLIDLVTPEGGLERVAAVHADPRKRALIEELQHHHTPELGSAHPAAQVVAEGRSQFGPAMPDGFLAAAARDQRHLEIVRELGLGSYMSVPLWADEAMLGAITLVSAGSGRIFGPEDLETAEQLARQVAGTVARVREREDEQRRAAEIEARHVALSELGTGLSAARSLADTAAAVQASGACSLGASIVWIGMLEDSRRRLRISTAGAVRPELAARYHLLSLENPSVTVEAVKSNRRIVAADTRRMPRALRAAIDDAQETRALAVSPLRAEDGSVMGVLGLSWPEVRELDAAELETFDAVAATVARAVARIVVVEREHEVATTLQERMLSLDSRSRAAALAALYEPSSEELRVGGDWYTATALDAGRLGISVGDVVGHGLPAVAAMGQLRSALSVAALGAQAPAEVLDLLDRYARGVPDAGCSTVAYAVIDPDSGCVEYACAGHPYPLLVTPPGELRWLEEGRRPPLGIDRRAAGTADGGREEFPPGSLLLLYSDGLVERHDEPLDTGFARLGEAVLRHRDLPVGELCAAVVAELRPQSGYDDDVALVAVRPAGTSAASHVDCFPAMFGEIPGARHRLRDWLTSLGAGPEERNRVLVAVGEAVNNAIEHGSGLDPHRSVTLEALRIAEDLLSATVSDLGRWAKDSAVSRHGGERGRGLALIHGLADHVRIARGPFGTRVTMQFRLTSPGVSESPQAVSVQNPSAPTWRSEATRPSASRAS